MTREEDALRYYLELEPKLVSALELKAGERLAGAIVRMVGLIAIGLMPADLDCHSTDEDRQAAQESYTEFLASIARGVEEEASLTI